MSILSESLKGLGNSTAKAVAASAKNVLNATREHIKESNRKTQILNKMSLDTLKALARQRGIVPEPFLGGKPSTDNYRESIASRMTLKELIEFARNRHIDIRDVEDSISRDVVIKELKQLDEDTSLSDEFKEIVHCVREFKPLGSYRNEYPYQAELAQWLQSRFPDTFIETQRGSSRPDIVTKGISIEVKGPTFKEDLQTISDKLLRYSQRFPKGIIVVLFDVDVTTTFYDEWIESIEDHSFTRTAHVEIIRVSGVSKTDSKTSIPLSQWQHIDKPVRSASVELGFCIRCGTGLKLDPKVPYCSKCYASWQQFKNNEYEEKHCHVCGQPNKSTIKRPACYGCYKAKKNVLVFPSA